ncbi:hypothetical protein KC351_g60 [Hortaea werneckii]|nr:hypothetical protein KC351_g60 [Hortaea werneckii]
MSANIAMIDLGTSFLGLRKGLRTSSPLPSPIDYTLLLSSRRNNSLRPAEATIRIQEFARLRLTLAQTYRESPDIPPLQ